MPKKSINSKFFSYHEICFMKKTTKVFPSVSLFKNDPKCRMTNFNISLGVNTAEVDNKKRKKKWCVE